MMEVAVTISSCSFFLDQGLSLDGQYVNEKLFLEGSVISMRKLHGLELETELEKMLGCSKVFGRYKPSNFFMVVCLYPCSHNIS